MNGWMVRNRRWVIPAVFILLAAFYFGFAAKRYATSHAYGDEPEYYLMAESIWNDGDLDLRNQYLAPDPRIFPGPLVWAVGPPGTESPANFPPANSAVLIGPAAAVGGVLGAYLIYALMNLASLWLLFITARRMVGEGAALVGVGIAGLTVPMAWMAATLWTEIPALLAVSGVLALASRIGDTKWAGGLAGLLLALLPFLHQKYTVLIVGLAAALLINPIRRRAWPWLVGLPLLGIGTMLLVSYITRGRASYTQSGTTTETASAFNWDLGRFAGQPFAWFIDQTRGYLPLAPVWILAIVGLIVLLRTRRGRGLLLMLAVGFAPFAVFYWFGPFLAGDAPPGRETLSMLPALVLLLCVGVASLRGPTSRAIAAIVAVPSVAIGVITPILEDQDLLYNNAGVPKVLSALSRYRLDLADLWPRITLETYWSVSRTAVMTLLTIAIAGVVVLMSSRARLRAGYPEAPEYPDPLAPTSASDVGA